MRSVITSNAVLPATDIHTEVQVGVHVNSHSTPNSFTLVFVPQILYLYRVPKRMYAQPLERRYWYPRHKMDNPIPAMLQRLTESMCILVFSTAESATACLIACKVFPSHANAMKTALSHLTRRLDADLIHATCRSITRRHFGANLSYGAW